MTPSEAISRLLTLSERVAIGCQATQEREQSMPRFHQILAPHAGKVVTLWDGSEVQINVSLARVELAKHEQSEPVFVTDLDQPIPSPIFQGADAAEFGPALDAEPDLATVLPAGKVRDHYDYPDGSYICRSTTKPQYWIAWVMNDRKNPVPFKYIDSGDACLFESAHEAAAALYDEGKGPASLVQKDAELPAVVGVAEQDRYDFEDGSRVERSGSLGGKWIALMPHGHALRSLRDGVNVRYFSTSWEATQALRSVGKGPGVSRPHIDVFA